MKIVKIQGGLGNQMFQYAFAKALEKKGHDVYLDLSLYEKKVERNGINYVHNGFELENLFAIEYKKASKTQIKKLGTIPNSVINRLRRKYFTKKTHYIDKVFRFSPEVLETSNDCYLDGYWQTEKYFETFSGEMRTLYQFKNSLSEKSQKVFEHQNKKMASIHVRRGDYLNGGLHDVCTKEYFNNAIDYAVANCMIEKLLVFSNDIEWCKANLTCLNLEVVFVDWNTGENSWQDLCMMSKCSANILSNSSFSWWAGWLNDNEDKTVIAPNVWNRREIDYKDNYYKFDYSDIVPDSWIRLPV